MLARRYSVTPSTFLKENISDFTFDLLVASVGIEAENKSNKKAVSRGK